jgi:hypothetical protein
MVFQVDQFSRASDGEKCSLLDGCWRANEGDDCAIVVQVGVAIQHTHSGDAQNGSLDGFDDFRAAGFRKIWDAFN